jgi:hypothetical protein
MARNFVFHIFPWSCPKDFGHLRWDAAKAQVNEAFASVPLAWIKAVGSWDPTIDGSRPITSYYQGIHWGNTLH